MRPIEVHNAGAFRLLVPPPLRHTQAREERR
jgi:hypothetical protein